MKRLIVLIILAGMTLSVWGQPPSVEIVTPVPGYYAITRNGNTLLLIDTETGEETILATSLTMSNPVWSNAGYRIAFAGEGLQIVDIDTGIIQSIIITPNSVDVPHSWSSNDTQILYEVGRFSEQQLGFFDLTDSHLTQIFQFQRRAEFSGFPIDHIPWSTSSLTLDFVENASWNPAYQDWVVFQFSIVSNDLAATDIYLVNVLYNWVTQEVISIDAAFPNGIDSTNINWHKDGKHFYAYKSNNDRTLDIYIAEFDPDLKQITITDTVRNIDNFYPLQWARIGDLLLGVGNVESGEGVVFLSQIVGGELSYTEMFWFVEPLNSWGRSWKFTGTPEEAAQISCIFDETLPTRLEIGMQAQIAFTDGTPSRLRSEPSTWGDVVQSLPEGTAFEIIGGYMCGSGYRWWQVQLANGMQGWVAESSEIEYWIERRAT